MEDIPLPIMVWIVPGTDNFFADGQTYHKIEKLDIELYTDDKDWALEKKIRLSTTSNMCMWQNRRKLWQRRAPLIHMMPRKIFRVP